MAKDIQNKKECDDCLENIAIKGRTDARLGDAKTAMHKPTDRLKAREDAKLADASSNDYNIAYTFLSASDTLFESELYQDYIVMPYLFLVRFYLELSFKAAIRSINEIYDCSATQITSNSGKVYKLDNVLSSHCLKTLYVVFKESLGKIDDQSYKNNIITSDLDNLINDISKYDYNSMGYRYSSDKQGHKLIPFSADSINLKNIKKKVDTTCSTIGPLFLSIAEWEEMIAECEQMMMDNYK